MNNEEIEALIKQLKAQGLSEDEIQKLKENLSTGIITQCCTIQRLHS